MSHTTATPAPASTPPPWLQQPVHTGDLRDPALHRRLASAVRVTDAADVVFGYSRDGHHAVCTGGTALPPPLPRDVLRYEIGSATKTFTTLLLAQLDHTGQLSRTDPAARHLAPGLPVGRHPATLLHLATHTAGLPRLPADFYPQALRRWSTNPYAGYPTSRLLDTFVRDHVLHRPRHLPGTRWRYSNFGVSVLGHALGGALSASWEDLVASYVLTPLGLGDTSTSPRGVGVDAIGRAKDGRTPVPPMLMGGFTGAGAIRSTPHDLLRYLDAQLLPARFPGLRSALHDVQRPLLRRGLRHQHTHTLSWFQHDTAYGPVYFHSGATCGQQAFLGFRPDTGTAVVALATRRFRAADTFQQTAHALLTAPP